MNSARAFGEMNCILQAAAIPYRCRDGQPEFCLITSIRRGTWGFPKGIVDPGETLQATALKEAEEEAGLHGRIVGDALGQYEYSKWNSVLLVTVFLMQVTVTDNDWDEARLRKRAWCRAEEARAAIDRSELRKLLDAALVRIKSQST